MVQVVHYIHTQSSSSTSVVYTDTLTAAGPQYLHIAFTAWKLLMKNIRIKLLCHAGVKSEQWLLFSIANLITCDTRSTHVMLHYAKTLYQHKRAACDCSCFVSLWKYLCTCNWNIVSCVWICSVNDVIRSRCFPKVAYETASLSSVLICNIQEESV